MVEGGSLAQQNPRHESARSTSALGTQAWHGHLHTLYGQVMAPRRDAPS